MPTVTGPTGTTRCTWMPGGLDLVGIQFARFDEILDLGDGDAARRRGRRIEVPGALPVDEVAVPIALPCVDEA